MSPDSLNLRYGILAPLGYHPSVDIRPDNTVLVISGAGAAMRRWGLKAPWDGKLIINARSETVEQKPSFRPLLEQRCLIPATAWYEWQTIAGAARKRKFHLRPRDGQSFCFAGLMNEDRIVLLTRAPAASIAHVHGRMPAVLRRDDEGRWIDPVAKFDDVRDAVASAGPEFAAEPLEDAPPLKPEQRDLFD